MPPQTLSLRGLVEFIAKSLVEHPEAVTVVEKMRRSGVVIELRVAPSDMGRVIGKEGRVANHIRTVLRAATVGENTRVTLDIL